MAAIDDIVDAWQHIELGSSFFLGHDSITLRREDYNIRGYRTLGNNSPPKGIIFHREATPYAFILTAPRRETVLDIALSGFSVKEDDVLDCTQIQGGVRRYRELRPIVWYGALLDVVITAAREADMSYVTVPSHVSVDGCDEKNEDRLKIIYDSNAQSHGMRFSAEMNRFVLELKRL